ncbi:hypothetical protein B566_EDAN002749 [Ephemera danica]|nr:hypothetical protein B566_EDAN002749 [Ephemera danica]
MKCSRFSNLHPPETLREFGEVTTLHGIRYITKPGSHFFDRLCWTLVIVGSAIMCAREVTKTYSRWRDSPVITSFAQQPTDVSSIPFPAVTICPESKVLRSVIDVEDMFDWLCDQLDNNTYNNPEDQLLAEAVSYVCVPETGQKLPSSMKPTLAHRRKIFEIAPQLEDVLEQYECKLDEMKALSNCGGLLGLFTGFSVISLMEICYFASLRLVCRLHQRGQQSSDETVTSDEVDKRGP